MNEFNPNQPPPPVPNRPAVCWTTNGGNNMSRIHIGNRQAQRTLCGLGRKGTFGPDWLEMGRPTAPNTLGVLGNHSAAISCPDCWALYEMERSDYERRRAAFDQACSQIAQEG